eukprot:15433447-Alexandrium_andersonii.AAC.1
MPRLSSRETEARGLLLVPTGSAAPAVGGPAIGVHDGVAVCRGGPEKAEEKAMRRVDITPLPSGAADGTE